MINQQHGRKYYWRCCGKKIAVTPNHVKENKYKICRYCKKDIPKMEISKAKGYLLLREFKKFK